MNDNRDALPRQNVLRSVLVLAALAVAIVAAIVLISGSRYFELRPATGTAGALAKAATPADGGTATPR